MHYPLFVDLRAQRVVVVGGGTVALRKIRTLRAAGARVVVISPLARAEIRRWAREGKLVWKRRHYRRGDLRGAMLVIAATDDRVVNEQVCREARRRRQLVNCVAPPSAGNFLVPALLRRGPICVAVSTGGASPALAALIRRELAQHLPHRYVAAARRLQALRQQLARSVANAAERARLLQAALRQIVRSRP